MNKQRVDESVEWKLYEVRRHVVEELERLPKRHAVAQASDSMWCSRACSSTSAAELTVPRSSDAEYRFEVAPRTLDDLEASLRGERSRGFTPLGDDLASASLGVRLSGGECYRRLLCLRFGVEYTALPLGTQKLLAFTRAECQRERGQRDCASTVEACATAEDVGKILQTESERHMWLNLLQTLPNGKVASVNWIEMA